MASLKYKPSKPVAVVSAVIGVGMIVFALTAFDDGPVAFLAFWCLAVVAIVGLNLWAAFSKDGGLATFVSDGD